MSTGPEAIKCQQQFDNNVVGDCCKMLSLCNHPRSVQGCNFCRHGCICQGANFGDNFFEIVVGLGDQAWVGGDTIYLSKASKVFDLVYFCCAHKELHEVSSS